MVTQTLHGQPDLGGDVVIPPTASHQGLYLGMWQTALHEELACGCIWLS